MYIGLTGRRLCGKWLYVLCNTCHLRTCFMISPAVDTGSVELMKERDLRDQWEAIVGEWREVICSVVSNRFR